MLDIELATWLVHPFVAGEVAQLYECRVTVLANIRPFTRVQALVNNALVRSRERRVAADGVALVRSLSGVCAFVSDVGTSLFE